MVSWKVALQTLNHYRPSVGRPIANRGEHPIAPTGIARMWILNENFVAYHREHLQLGTTGYMISGNDKVAECKVIELNF